MIGQRLESRPRLLGWVIFFLLVSATLVVLAIVQWNVNYAVGALLPAVLAVQLWRAGNIDFACTVAADRLLLEPSREAIVFDDIQGLSIEGQTLQPDDAKFRNGNLHVLHRQGGFVIPRSINAPIRDLYRFLIERVPAAGGSVGDGLQEHYYEQCALFGAERVYAYGTRQHLQPRLGGRVTGYVGVAMMLAALGWVIVPVLFIVQDELKNKEPPEYWFAWIGGGVFMGIIGLLVWMAGKSHTPVGRRVRNWKESTLVISPTGIALMQGDLRGKLRWEELLDVSAMKMPFFGQNIAGAGILLKVEAAQIHVEDIYQRPAPIIQRLIEHYWKPER